jgi:2-methylisocitrate lyase-like PEP mutase family enzyme
MSLVEDARAFRRLHEAPPLLLLPNAWDVSSAKLFEVAGFQALATTSAGIAASVGYADGERIPLDEMLAVAGRIIAHSALPVSLDMEAGYSATPEGAAESAGRAMAEGAVGINIEDGTGDPAGPLCDPVLMCAKVGAIRDRVLAAGVPLFINVRTDVFLVDQEITGDGMRRIIERSAAYIDSGADGIFVPTPLDRPGLLGRDVIRRLVDEIDAPLNVLAGAVTLPLGELEEIGVARVSLGPAPMRAALALIRRIAVELRDRGTYGAMMERTIPYSEVNSWFEGDR